MLGQFGIELWEAVLLLVAIMTGVLIVFGSVVDTLMRHSEFGEMVRDRLFKVTNLDD